MSMFSLWYYEFIGALWSFDKDSNVGNSCQIFSTIITTFLFPNNITLKKRLDKEIYWDDLPEFRFPSDNARKTHTFTDIDETITITRPAAFQGMFEFFSQHRNITGALVADSDFAREDINYCLGIMNQGKSVDMFTPQEPRFDKWSGMNDRMELNWFDFRDTRYLRIW